MYFLKHYHGRIAASADLTLLVKTFAKVLIASSPPSWPNVSFMALKSSISKVAPAVIFLRQYRTGQRGGSIGGNMVTAPTLSCFI